MSNPVERFTLPNPVTVEDLAVLVESITGRAPTAEEKARAAALLTRVPSPPHS